MAEPIAKPAYFVAPAKAKLHVHKAAVQKIVKRLDTVFRRYDAQGLLQWVRQREMFSASLMTHQGHGHRRLERRGA
jgi:hypothetical protein